ncbi:MAG: hypothetical protein IPK82_37240 [Polyangiaceae bacterium]|nr:hypothetical protein [Polyangiaceae bacterium]
MSQDLTVSSLSSSSFSARSRWPVWVAAAAASAAVVLAPEVAAAQGAPATGDAKGVVGGALLGAEVVDLTLGIIGINRGWPYLVFGALGAAGGGVGGYFVEQETRDAPEVPLYMLAGGMALVIPTIVVSLNATMYKPPEGTVTTVEPANNAPAPAPGSVQPPPPTQSHRRTVTPPRTRLTMSIVGVSEGQLALSAPAVEVRPLYSQREMFQYGVTQGTEVRVPIFSASF